MPNITLDKTAAKGVGLEGRVAKFDDKLALKKLEEIQTHLGPEGTTGNLRIIYTTKSNKDLQFDTRKKTWWGGLYTPSEGRQSKNEAALRVLFNKAGKNLSPEAKQQLETELTHFFKENAKGIKSLKPLIEKFKEISAADQKPLVSNDQPNLVIPQDSEKQIVEENNHQKNNKPSVLEEPEVHEDDRILTDLKQGQPIDANPDSSFSSKIDDRRHGLEENIPQDINAQVVNQVPQTKDVLKNSSFISEEEPDDLNKSNNSLIDNEEQSIKNDIPFGSNLEVDQESESGNGFFHSVENDQDENQSIRYSNYSYRFSDIINPNLHLDPVPDPEPVPIPVPIPEPVINKEELRAKASKELEDINALMNSSLPQDIDALSRKVSEFQDDRKKQHDDLRERATEIQSRFNHGDKLPSIPEYYRDLQKLNADIKKFSQFKLDDSIKKDIKEFQKRINDAETPLKSFMPEGMFFDEIHDIFPELECSQKHKQSLENIQNEFVKSYSIPEQTPNEGAIQAIHQEALGRLDYAGAELFDTLQIMEEIEYKLGNNIKDLNSIEPDSNYDSAQLDIDFKKVDEIYQQLGDLNKEIDSNKNQLVDLKNQLSEDHQIYQKSLGEGCPDFESLLSQTKSAMDEVQAAGERLTGLLQRKEEILTRLKTVHQESVALKEEDDQKRKAIQAVLSEQRTEELRAEQLKKAEAAKQQRIGSIQESLDDAFEQSEKLISDESENSFQEIQELFPDELDDMILYVDRVRAGATVSVPQDLVERLRKDLNAHLDNQIVQNGPVDSAKRQEWKAQINSKIKEWSQRSYYSEGQKQNLEKLIATQWGEEIKTQASLEISKIEYEIGRLQNLIAEREPKLSLERYNLRDEVENLEKQVAGQTEEFEAMKHGLEALEARKKGISPADSSQDALSAEIFDLQQKIIDLESKLESTTNLLQDKKKEQIAQTFSNQYPEELSAMMRLDEKIGFIKKSVNNIGVEFP